MTLDLLLRTHDGETTVEVSSVLDFDTSTPNWREQLALQCSAQAGAGTAALLEQIAEQRASRTASSRPQSGFEPLGPSLRHL